MESSPKWFIHNTIPAPKGQGSLWRKKWDDCKSQRNRTLVRQYVLETQETKKPHQNGCLNSSLTGTPPIDMRRGQAYKASALDKERQATKECWEQEQLSSLEKNTTVHFPIPNKPQNICANSIWTEPTVFVYLWIYTVSRVYLYISNTHIYDTYTDHTHTHTTHIKQN